MPTQDGASFITITWLQLSETAQLTVLQALNGHIKATATNSSNRLDHMHDRSTDQLLTVSVRRVTTGRYINTYWRQLTKASQSSSIVIGTLEEPLQSSTLCLLDYQTVEDHYEKSKSLTTIANLLKRFPAISSHTSSRRRTHTARACTASITNVGASVAHSKTFSDFLRLNFLPTQSNSYKQHGLLGQLHAQYRKV